MSVKVMGAVWDLKIGRDEKLVLLAYADHASHDGSSIYPAVSTIAEKTGYSERSVQSITRDLEQQGYLIPDGQGMHGTNRWRIPICGGLIVAEARGADSAPVQESDEVGAENDDEGCRNEPKGVQPVAPDSSLNVIKTSIEKNDEKQKFITDFENAARFVFGCNSTPWHKLERELVKDCVRIVRCDGTMTISGMGEQATVFQDRYASTFQRALSGIYNHNLKIVFAP
jgi:hypothetical protein